MLVWDKSLWINLAGVLPGQQEILHRSGVSDPRVQRWIYEGIYFGFPLGQHQLPKTQWKPAPNKSLSSTWRDRLCLQQLHLKNKRCHSQLHQICQDSELVCFYMGYTTAHLPCDLLRLSNKGGRGKQQHQLPQLQHGKSSRGGCWRMARRAGVHPLNLPRDSRCCNLLQAEKSSKPRLSLQCGQSTEGAKPPGSHAPLQCLQSCNGICCVCPCLCSFRLGWRVQSASSRYFHSHFHLECLLFPFVNCCIPEVQRAENSSSKTWQSAIEGKINY